MTGAGGLPNEETNYESLHESLPIHAAGRDSSAGARGGRGAGCREGGGRRPWDRLVRDWLSACRGSSRKAWPPERRRSTRLIAYIIADDGAQPTVFDK